MAAKGAAVAESSHKDARKEVVNDARRHKMSARNLIAKYHLKDEEEAFDRNEGMLKTMFRTSPDLDRACKIDQIIKECGFDCKEYFNCKKLFDATSSSSSSSSASSTRSRHRPCTEKVSFDDMLNLCTSLKLLRTKLGLNVPCTLQDIVSSFSNLYYPAAAAGSIKDTTPSVTSDDAHQKTTNDEEVKMIIGSNDTDTTIEAVNEDGCNVMDIDKSTMARLEGVAKKSIGDLLDDFDRDDRRNGDVKEEDDEAVSAAANPNPDLSIKRAAASEEADGEADALLNAQLFEQYLLERLQLILTKEILVDVSSTYSLDGYDNRSISTKAMVATDVPLNQLTYREIARISLIYLMLEEISINKTSEEVEYYIRGEPDNSTPYSMNKKYIVQFIRTKMAARARAQTVAIANIGKSTGKEGFKSVFFYANMLSENIQKSYDKFSVHIDKYNSTISGYLGKYSAMLSSDGFVEITGTLRSHSLNFENSSSVFPSIYRRIIKIFLKIIELNEAEMASLFGDSRFSDSDYTIRDVSWFDNRHSVTIAQIAQMIVGEEYTKAAGDCCSDGNSVDISALVPVLFYDDMMKYFFTITSFHTNIATKILVQKAVFVLNRFVDSCLVDVDNNAAAFDSKDELCLLTRLPITTIARTQTIFCSKCTGAFSIDGLVAFYNACHISGIDIDIERNSSHEQLGPYLFLPATSSHYMSGKDEVWFCPFCVSEDTCRLCDQPFSDGCESDAFSFNGYGASLRIPWQLSEEMSTSVGRKLLENPTVRIYMNALKVLADSSCSSDVFHNDPIQGSPDFIHDMTPWSRIRVLLGLCEGIKASFKGSRVLESVYKDGAALFDLARSGDTRPGEFSVGVGKLCGEETAIKFTNFLCQINRKKSFEIGLKALDGRCVVCKKSSDDTEDKVILCDFCNGDTHLLCSGLPAVTRSSYYCLSCQKFIKQHELQNELLNDKNRHSVRKDFSTTRATAGDINLEAIKYFFDNIDDFREHNAEDVLIEKAIQKKIKARSVDGHVTNTINFQNSHSNGVVPSPIQASSSSTLKCRYCDFTEIELCSPFVVGQSRSEHDEYVSSFLSRLKQSELNEIASMQQEQSSVGVNIDPPYFPRLDSQQSKPLRDAYNESGATVNICHEFCALHLFQNRLKNSSIDAKKRRYDVANKALLLCGVKTVPLGYDEGNRSYWYFSCSPNLFIFCSSNDKTSVGDDGYYVNMPDDFKKFCLNYATIAKNEGVWKVVINSKENIHNIQNIINNLSNTCKEHELKNNLISFFITTNDAIDLSESNIGGGVSNAFLSSSNYNAASTSSGNHASSDNGSVSSNTNIPHEIVLSPSSAPIADVYFIADTSSVCKEVDRTIPEGFDPKDYIKYQKNGKFLCVSIHNSAGVPLKFTKNSGISMTFQVHHELFRESVVCETVKDQWQHDLAYYFQVPDFRRAGRYILTFIVEGRLEEGAVIDPLVYEITVKHTSAVTGYDDAIDQLRALNFLYASGRCFSRNLHDEIIDNSSELQAVKSSLLCLYYALPTGCIAIGDENAISDAFSRIVSSQNNTWSDLLDQIWRGAVTSATSALELMECCLLLESCIDRSWVQPPFDQYLDNVLPRYSYAVRAATLSSVALRVYYLDRAIDYSKVARRKNNGDSRAHNPNPTLGNRSNAYSGRQAATEVTGSGRISKKIYTNVSSDTVIDDIENDYSSGGRPRVKRAAASQANSNIRKQVCNDRASYREDDDYEDDDEEEEEEEEDDGEEEEEEHRRVQISQRGRQIVPVVPAHKQQKDQERLDKQLKEQRRREKDSVISRSSTHTFEPFATVQQSRARGHSANSGSHFDFDALMEVVLLDRFDSEEEREINLAYFNVLKSLQSDSSSYIFWRPVSSYEAPDYKDVISRPMDLETICKKVVARGYGVSSDSFCRDIMQVWSNCLLYNGEHDPISHIARDLRALSEDVFTENSLISK